MTKKQISTVLAKLEQGVADIMSSGNWQQYLKVQSQFHSYSFRNVLLIWQQNPNATRVAGYKRWQTLGRQVKKGQKGITILAPLKRKLTTELDNGETVEKIALFGFKTTTVFDISQTEGEDLPEIVSPLSGDDQGLIARLKAFTEANNVPVNFVGCLGRNGSCHYNPTTGKPIEIRIDPQLPPLHQAKTLAHEIAHSLLHTRDKYSLHTPISDAELEAESVAFIVLDHFGLNSSNYSFSYIAHWQQSKDALQQLQQSGQRIQDTASKIIDALEQ